MSVPVDRDGAPGAGLHNARVARTVVAALAARHREGLSVVLSPGSRNTPLAIAFDEHNACEVHVVLDERAAGFVALGLGKATGRAAVLCCTSGSAAGHYVPAVMEASESRVPLVVLTADRPPEKQACGAPQTVTQGGMFGPWARLSLTAPTPDEAASLPRIAALADQIAAAAEGSPPGPAHLNAPFRKPLWAASEHQEALPLGPRRHRGMRRLDDAALGDVAEALAGKRGVITCGPLAPATVDAAALRRELSALAETLAWPLLADPASGLRFGAGSLGHHDLFLRHEPTAEALTPDVVLHVGATPTSKALNQWLATAPSVVLLDADGELADPQGVATHVVVADPVATARDLAARVTPAKPRWRERWRKADAAARGGLAPLAQGSWQGAIARGVVEALGEGSLLHLASSMPIREVDAHAASRATPLDVLASRGVNGIDGTLACFLGAMLGRKARGQRQPGVCLVGDLALLHDLDGLLTWAALGRELPATAVVVDNGGGHIFDWLPVAQQIDAAAYERLFVTPQPVSIGPVVEGLGHRHQRVAPEALGPALAAELERPGLGVLVVPVDPVIDRDHHRRAVAAVFAALEADA